MKTATVKGMVDDAIKELDRQLAAGKSDQLKRYLQLAARFHRYSIGNAILIGTQCPTAIRVAGFHTWRKMGRQVRKGERAIRILAPVTRKEKLVFEDDEEEIIDETVIAYRQAFIFDISQTDGKPLPSLSTVEGDPSEYADRLKAFVEQCGIRLSYSNRLRGAEGISQGGTILVSSELDAAESFSTLVHELAHELLHQDGDCPKDHAVRETEAEAVAFVVSEAVQLETNRASSDYIQLHQGDRKLLMASLQRIKRVANLIIHAVKTDNADSRADRAWAPQRALAA